MRAAFFRFRLRTIAFALASFAAIGQDSRSAWLEDVDRLGTELPKVHPDLFRRLSPDAWANALAACRENVRDADDETRVVALRKVVAAVGDSHTRVYADRTSETPPTRRLPVAFYYVNEGPIVFAIPEEFGEHAGKVVATIGGVPMEEARKRFSTLVAAENVSLLNLQIADLMTDAAALKALGFHGADGAVAFGVVDEAGVGAAFTLRPPADADEARKIKFKRTPDFSDFPKTSDPRRPIFGSAIYADVETLFVWYDACRDDGTKTVKDFVAATLDQIDAGLSATPPLFRKVVVDLRRNGGGDSRLLDPLIDGVASRAAFKERGRLAVLVGRQTFSSAVLNAWAFRRKTTAVFFGEPTGGALNHFGEIKTFRLPRSKLVVQHSTKEFRLVEGEGATFEPDVAVEITAARFRSARDAAFEESVK